MSFRLGIHRILLSSSGFRRLRQAVRLKICNFWTTFIDSIDIVNYFVVHLLHTSRNFDHPFTPLQKLRTGHYLKRIFIFFFYTWQPVRTFWIFARRNPGIEPKILKIICKLSRNKSTVESIGKHCFLMTCISGNTGNQPILITLDPGNTERHPSKKVWILEIVEITHSENSGCWNYWNQSIPRTLDPGDTWTNPFQELLILEMLEPTLDPGNTWNNPF